MDNYSHGIYVTDQASIDKSTLRSLEKSVLGALIDHDHVTAVAAIKAINALVVRVDDPSFRMPPNVVRRIIEHAAALPLYQALQTVSIERLHAMELYVVPVAMRSEQQSNMEQCLRVLEGHGYDFSRRSGAYREADVLMAKYPDAMQNAAERADLEFFKGNKQDRDSAENAFAQDEEELKGILAGKIARRRQQGEHKKSALPALSVELGRQQSARKQTTTGQLKMLQEELVPAIKRQDVEAVAMIAPNMDWKWYAFYENELCESHQYHEASLLKDLCWKTTRPEAKTAPPKAFLNNASDMLATMVKSGYNVLDDSYLLTAMTESPEVLADIAALGEQYGLRGSDGGTLLHYAVCGTIPFLDVVKNIIRGGADVNRQDYLGDTPFHLLWSLDTIEMADTDTSAEWRGTMVALLNAGADTSIQNNIGVSGYDAMARVLGGDLTEDSSGQKCLARKAKTFYREHDQRAIEAEVPSAKKRALK